MADHTLCVFFESAIQKSQRNAPPGPCESGASPFFCPISQSCPTSPTYNHENKKGLRRNEILLQLIGGIPRRDQRRQRGPRGMDSAHRR